MFAAIIPTDTNIAMPAPPSWGIIYGQRHVWINVTSIHTLLLANWEKEKNYKYLAIFEFQEQEQKLIIYV